jgi:hypothetical protein
MHDPIIYCATCGQSWTADALDPLSDVQSRVAPGDIFPLGQCPNPECRALYYPASGYGYALVQQRRALHELLTQLLNWAAAMGGWDAPVWQRARRLLARSTTRTHTRLAWPPGQGYTLQATLHGFLPQTWHTLRTRAPLEELRTLVAMWHTATMPGYVRYRIFQGAHLTPTILIEEGRVQGPPRPEGPPVPGEAPSAQPLDHV